MARSEAQKAAERNYEKKRGPRKRKRIDKRGKRDRTSDQRDRRSRKAAQPSLAGALDRGSGCCCLDVRGPRVGSSSGSAGVLHR